MTRRRVFLRAGLFAEGKSDYHFLLPLLDRLLDTLTALHFPGMCDIQGAMGIDAPHPGAGGRAERIAAALAAHWLECNLLVVHADGAGDPGEALRDRVTPGLEAARDQLPDVVTAACIPVRETEAWMLADAEVFELLGSKAPAALPSEPEREADPKLTLDHMLGAGRKRRASEEIYQFFGENVRFEALRALPSFAAFESELSVAVQAVARSQHACR